MDGLDDFEGAGVVEGCESGESLEVVVGVAVDAGGLVVVATVDDAVAGESDVIRVLEFLEVWVRGEVFEDGFESILGVGDVVDLFALRDGGRATGVGERHWRCCEACDRDGG